MDGMEKSTERKEYLEKMVMGLEQSIENTRREIPYYDPGDLQLRYAKKFLTAMESTLQSSLQELKALKISPQKT